MTASLPDRLRKAADELESLRCAEDAALMREAAVALSAKTTCLGCNCSCIGDAQAPLYQRVLTDPLPGDGRVIYKAGR